MKKQSLIKLAVALGAFTLSTHGQAATWVGGNSTWQTAGNWSPSGVPTSSTDVLINTTDTITASSGGAMNAKDVTVDPAGTGSAGSIVLGGTTSSTLNFNSLTLSSAASTAGKLSALQFNVAGTVNIATNITLAAGAGHGQITFGTNGTLNVGGGTGSIVNGGGAGTALISTRAVGVSINAASVGVDTIRMGDSATSSSLTINSGQSYVADSSVDVGYSTGGTQTLNLNGGTLTTAALRLNVGATGNDAVVNLNGTTVSATSIQRVDDGASQQFNWNSGTISNISSGNLTINKGAASSANLVLSLAGTGAHTFDISSGKSATVEATAILADKAGEHGTLTKAGTGTLTLAAVNTYTGITTISAGTLVIASTGSIAGSSAIDLGTTGTLNVSSVSGGFALASGQTLKGSGTVVGAVTVASGATLAIGNSPGTVTFDNNLTLASGSISDFEINGLTAGLYDLAQGGIGIQTVAFNGTLNLAFQSGFNTEGSMKIFDFENYSGNFSVVNVSGLASGYSASFNDLTGMVTVVPEPATWALFTAGLMVTTILRRRRMH